MLLQPLQQLQILSCFLVRIECCKRSIFLSALSTVRDKGSSALSAVKSTSSSAISSVRGSVAAHLPTIQVSQSTAAEEVGEAIRQLQLADERDMKVHTEYKTIIAEKDARARHLEDELALQQTARRQDWAEIEQLKQSVQEEKQRNSVLATQLVTAADTITQVQTQLEQAEKRLIPLSNKLALTERQLKQTTMLLKTVQGASSLADEIVQLHNQIQVLKEQNAAQVAAAAATAAAALII